MTSIAFMPAATPESWATAIILDREGHFHEVTLDSISIRPPDVAEARPDPP
jgi:hypothetical protein